MSRLPANTNPVHENVLFMMVSLAPHFSKERANPKMAARRRKADTALLADAPILLS